jgi:hypothetical protein
MALIDRFAELGLKVGNALRQEQVDCMVRLLGAPASLCGRRFQDLWQWLQGAVNPKTGDTWISRDDVSTLTDLLRHPHVAAMNVAPLTAAWGAPHRDVSLPPDQGAGVLDEKVADDDFGETFWHALGNGVIGAALRATTTTDDALEAEAITAATLASYDSELAAARAAVAKAELEAKQAEERRVAARAEMEMRLREAERKRAAAAPGAAPAPADAAEPECAVCMDAACNAVLVECGHSRFCLSCAQTLVGKPCPFCRAPVSRAIRLF